MRPASAARPGAGQRGAPRALEPVTLVVNGRTLGNTEGGAAQVRRGRVLVPLRSSLWERMGARVRPERRSMVIRVTGQGAEVRLLLNHPGGGALVNGSSPGRAGGYDPQRDFAQEVDGQVLLPLRFVAGMLGARVTWHRARREVHLTR